MFAQWHLIVILAEAMPAMMQGSNVKCETRRQLTYNIWTPNQHTMTLQSNYSVQYFSQATIIQNMHMLSCKSIWQLQTVIKKCRP